MTSLDKLNRFRQSIYYRLGNAKDALFDLMDAVLTTRSISSFVELSLSPLFRRKWPSIYEALQDAHPPRQLLMREYAKEIPASELIVLAGDHTAWSRIYAKTLRERTYEHQPQPLSGAVPITLGQGYSTIAWIPETQGSWALPLVHERITSFETPLEKAATQLRQVCLQLAGPILFLADSEYGCAPFVKQTSDLRCDQLLRLRPNRVLYQSPPKYQGQGRPRKHGPKFALKALDTWHEPQEQLLLEDTELGRVRVRCWTSLHFKQAAEHPFSVILVERLDAPSAKPLWLVWISKQHLSVAQLWRQYLRRFALEHWYRFVRQRLHWTVPQLSTAQQMEAWSDLMPLLTWQLWLARPLVEDMPLPWQKKVASLSPGRVADSITALLARIGTPAPDPKPRGKSPGWATGRKRTQRPRYPTIKKRASKPKKKKKVAA
jgi:hypothetical protein